MEISGSIQPFHVFSPETGSHRSFTENSSISIIASQKFGTALNTVASSVEP